MLTRRACIRALTFLILNLRDAYADGATRSVSGVVTDKRGNLLPGAVVQIDNSVSKEIQSYIVQKDGKYQFRDLNPNVEFVLHAQYHGHLSKNWTYSKFNDAKDAKMDFIIPVE
jgi:Carboxypeptidase regulatory-like domain